MATVGGLLARAAERLKPAGVPDAEREALWLLAHQLGWTAGAARSRLMVEVAEPDATAFLVMVNRRAAREPIQYIIGTEEFMGLTFQVTPAVLIPRPDTEVLVRVSAARLTGPVRIADIGTGSGCIAVALALALPEARVVAVDLSAEALRVAAANAAVHGVDARVEFRQGDLLAPLAGEDFHAILSNPPYIGVGELSDLAPEVAAWEPHMALTPGPDGTEAIRRILAQAATCLAPDGFIGIEIGAGQAEAIQDLFRSSGYAPELFPDSGGMGRMVLGRRVAKA